MQITLEVQKHIVAQKPRAPELAAWTIVLKTETAQQIVSIYDAWVGLVAERLGDKFIPQKIDSLRAKISSGENFAYVAVVPPALLRAKINYAVEKTVRSRNDVLRQVLMYGLPKISGKSLAEQMPDTKPSMSLVIVSVMEAGYPQFEKDFGVPPLPAAATPAIGEKERDDDAVGRPLQPRHDPKYWTVGLAREHAKKTVELIIAIRDAWAKKVRETNKDRQFNRLNEVLKKEAGTIFLGVYALPSTQQRALQLADSRRRPKNYVADWALVNGVKNLTLKKVQQVCEPDQTPSISQVAGVALKIGLDLFEKKFPAIGGSGSAED